MKAAPPIAGKYDLLRHIAVGGMAEVFLARQRGLSGFEKLVCIKRILPERSAEPEFVRMFLDEARTAADLRHPNVVDVYEIGETPNQDDVGTTLFLAMEYIHGHSVREIQEAAAALGRGIPLSLGLQIALEVARGLHYAHQKKDLRGKPLGIVHRDVSPQNLLVTFDGITKIVDFGIAKARGRTSTTSVGMVKGKAAYMSPEQATGLELDGRSDLFSLGAIIYELTTGRRLFTPGNDLSGMDALVHAEVVPPTSFLPGYPPALEAILLSMLRREPEDRPPTGAAVAAAIEDFLTAQGTPVSHPRMEAFLRELWPDADGDLDRLLVSEAETARGAKMEDAETGAVSASVPPLPASARALSREASTTPIPTSGTGLRTNLASDSGRFVGRAADLEALTANFRRGERLVTLHGPGGAGKTRLALRFAHDRLDEFNRNGGGGVWFVDLTGARSAADVLGAVGAALGIPLTGGGTVAQTAAHLGQALVARGRILVVLDNFEQVAAAAPETLGRLLALSADTRFLVTSQELLRIDGEVVQELAPLPLPVRGSPAGDSEAVQLFVQRARAVRSDFELDAENGPVVADIVKMLDGLPLAIELAASRMRVFTPAQLLERLPRRFDLLGGARRDVSDRQSTLRGAIDWSWSLLSVPEQSTLSQLSVFRGGFGIEAAEAVVEAASAVADRKDFSVADVVQSLREKSLLRVYESPERSGELRFGLYESVREYAAEKLGATGGDTTAVVRHGEYHVRVATAWADAVDLHGGRERLRRLFEERENLAAIHRRASRGSGPRGATLGVLAVLAVEPVYLTRGPFAAYVQLLDEAIAYAGFAGVEGPLLARALRSRGHTRRMQGLTADAREDLEAAMAIAERAGDAGLEGRILRNVGLLSWDEGRFEESRVEYARALGLHRKANDRQFEGRTLGDLACFDLEQGILDDALEKSESAIAILREVGDRRFEGVQLGYLGALLQERERMEASRGMYDRAIAIHREFGDRRYEAMFSGYQGTLFHERGDLESARREYKHAVRLSRELGDRRQEAFYLSFLGVAQVAIGRLDEARATLDAAASRLEAIGDRLLLTMCAIQRGHLELADAAAKPAALAAARLRVEDRIRAAEADGSAGWTGPASATSLARTSMDIRLAIRLLRRVLAR